MNLEENVYVCVVCVIFVEYKEYLENVEVSVSFDVDSGLVLKVMLE